MASKKNLNSGAAAATAKLFSGNSTTTKKENNKLESLAKEDNSKKVKKEGFSFRGTPEDVKKWRAYGNGIKATKSDKEFTIDDIWAVAINDYIKKHPLDGLAKAVFDEKMKD